MPITSLYKVPTLAQPFCFVTSENFIVDIVHSVYEKSYKIYFRTLQVFYDNISATQDVDKLIYLTFTQLVSIGVSDQGYNYHH